MTREEIIRLIIQCGMWSNDIGYYEGHIVHIHEAMILYADQETSALRAENERLRGLIKQMWYEEVGKYFDNISEKDHWYEQFETENNL